MDSKFSPIYIPACDIWNLHVLEKQCKLSKFQGKDVLARKTPLEFNTSAQLGKIRPGFSSICLMLNIEYFLLLFSAGATGKAKQKFDI